MADESVKGFSLVADDANWRLTVSEDFRTIIRQKFYNDIKPATTKNESTQNVVENRLKDLMTFTIGVEEKFYKEAKSRENYFDLLATKASEIQEDIKKNRDFLQH